MVNRLFVLRGQHFHSVPWPADNFPQASVVFVFGRFARCSRVLVDGGWLEVADAAIEEYDRTESEGTHVRINPKDRQTYLSWAIWGTAAAFVFRCVTSRASVGRLAPRNRELTIIKLLAEYHAKEFELLWQQGYMYVLL